MEPTEYAPGTPSWVDLGSPDIDGSAAFYSGLFGWSTADAGPPEETGGYGFFTTADGKMIAGYGPQQNPGPPFWTTYVMVDSAEDVSAKVTAAGGSVVMPPMDVMEAGRMAIFTDPTGAFISAWEAELMPGAQASGSGTLGWAELNDRDVDAALPFYQQVFGWASRHSGEGAQRYTEFQLGGQSIAGAVAMNPMVPDGVPNHWLVYFAVDDVDATHRAAVEAGATDMLAPADFNGGRFAILGDPQGAAFGLLRLADLRG